MKKLRIALAIILIGLILSACSTSPDIALENPDTPIVSDAIVLEIIGLNETRSLTMAELQAFEAVSGWGGTKSSAGVISPPQELRGVELASLLELVGGLEPGLGVSIIAKDGYGMTMSYEQVIQGDFITYDPGTGDENTPSGPLQTIVAYQRAGEPIPATEDGPLRLFVISDKNDNVVDGHWSVKWVTQIRLKPMSEDWSLNLEGVIGELMDRNSFESCSAPGCHQASWTDENGDVWSGVPLYYLAGRVDDGVRHEGRAYNDDFARAGYVLQLFSADGASVGIESSRSDFNRQIFVASLVNGEPLGVADFPLRLVGEDLEKSEMVGQLLQLVIQPNPGVALPSSELPEAGLAEAEPDLSLPEGALLKVLGQVQNPLILRMENLEAFGIINLDAEHPKRGLQSYRGVPLNALLNLVGLQESAASLMMVAGDGYQSEISLAAVQACTDCLIAIREDNSLSLVMVEMESNYWINDLVALLVK